MYLSVVLSMGTISFLLCSLFLPVSAFVPWRQNRRRPIIKPTPVASGPCLIQEETRIHTTDVNPEQELWLVCGDGDLSYSATLAPTLTNGVKLIASVLEDESMHQQVYRNSQQNTNAIISPGDDHEQHEVQFGVDATRLEDYFEPNSVDRIIFNFPHWRGKSNHRHNRLLVKEFLSSSAKVLSKNGEIHVALLNGQGGWEESSLEDWKRTWTVPMFANEAGLLLDRVKLFNVDYNLSSYRGSDRPFSKSQIPRRYVFQQSNGLDQSIQEKYQMSTRHELRLELDRSILQAKGYSVDDLTEGNLILNLLQSKLQSGIRAEMPLREVIPLQHVNPGNDYSPESELLVCLMVYSGESQPMTQELGNQIRARLEDLVDEQLGLKIHKRNYQVSRAFPHKFLEGLLQVVIASHDS